MSKIKLSFLLGILLLVLAVVSCKKDQQSSDLNLPVDTGGTQTPVYYNSNLLEYGYFVYTPSSYEQNEALYPLLVFLHGSGEKGNSMTTSTELNKLLNNGITRLIGQKKWSPPHPMIVVSPQCHETSWNGKKIHKLIKYLIANYRVNKHRIYLTGLSMGGYGTFNYLETCSDTGYVAAAVPICGGGNTNNAKKLLNIPLWAFHGESDVTVDPLNSINMINAIKALNPSLKPKLTLYPGVFHDSWSRTYDGSGMGTEDPLYDPFNMSIFDWMFLYTK